MSIRTKAFCVHLLTASGAVLAMLALLAAVAQDWSQMFLWLLIALIVDGIDGPLARRFDVTENAPAIDGVLLDLIIDYLTYVFIPAYALFQFGLIPGTTGWIALFAITYGSALYFADTGMKTPDKSFSGFPGCWNMVVLVLFALRPEPALCLIAIITLTAAMFLPINFVHPVRTKRWRGATLGATALWVIAAAVCVAHDFGPPKGVLWILGLSSAYLSLAGAAQQVFKPTRDQN